MPGRKGLLAPQNTFLDTIATRFDGTRKSSCDFSSIYIADVTTFISFSFYFAQNHTFTAITNSNDSH